MSGKRPYRILLFGPAPERKRLQAALSATAEPIELLSCDADEQELLQGEAIARMAPDVAIVTSSVERPLPVARHVRTVSPNSQVLFLLPDDRLERFRAGLPFVPDLASSWTASTAADPSALSHLVFDAARASRQRSATAAVLARVNQQLARKAGPAEVRRTQLALSERYLATILTQSPDAFLAVDKAGVVIAHNDAALKLFGPGFEPGQAVTLTDLLPEDEGAKLADLLRRAADGETFSGIDVRLASAGDDAQHLELSLAPVHAESGAIASVSITARDITERKRAERHQRLLINELNHRVKNTLAIVQALAQQSFRGLAPLDEERAAFASRLAALSAAHNLLTRQTWDPVPLAEVIEATLSATCGDGLRRHKLEGPGLTLSPQTAVSVALALHELCTNAIKYGALSNETGRIETRWDVYEGEGGARLRLEWSECGGPPVEPPTKRGFGSRMIERGLASELNGEVRLDFRREGVVCTIDAPLPAAGGDA